MAGPWLKSAVNKLFSKYLLVTNCVGISCMLAAGDTIEQRLVQRVMHGEKAKEQDWDRTGRMFVSGITMGSVSHFWYGWLDRRFPGTALRKFASKMVLDTAIGVPLTNVSWFFTIGLLDGMDAKESAWSSIVKLPPIIVGELAFWSPAQAINFYFLPPRFRVMYLGVVSLAWTSYMSFIQYNYGTETPAESVPETETAVSSVSDVQSQLPVSQNETGAGGQVCTAE